MDVLKQLSGMPGVVGSMLFDQGGQVVDSSFPELFDASLLGQVASGLASDGYFAQWCAGEQSAYDLHFAQGRVVVHRVASNWLLVLCTPQANAQLLQMSLTQVLRRLKASPPPAPPPAQPARATPAPRLALSVRLRSLVQAELGPHAAQALELLKAGGEDPSRLATAVDDIEKLTRLFIDKKKAEELGRKLRDVLASERPSPRGT